MSEKIFTPEEIAKHNQEEDLWIVYENGVYDLTKFLYEHPGGPDVLMEVAGKDGTECFDKIGHSDEAIKRREDYKIGKASGPLPDILKLSEEKHKSVQDTTIDDDNWQYEPPKYESSPWLPVFVAAGVVIYGVIIYYFWYS